MLCAGDVRAAALLIRKQIKDEFHLLEHNIDAFNDRRFESATNKRLFCWNSWHKAGSSMCTADFGEDMLEFEWLNLFNHIDTDTVLVNAATAKVDSLHGACRDGCSPHLLDDPLAQLATYLKGQAMAGRLIT
jgi:hypothetical protein